MKTLNLIGSGRVGSTLARLWQSRQTFQTQDVLTQSHSSASEATVFIGAGRPVATMTSMRPADLWMIAVPDREISGVANALSSLNPPDTKSFAFHCSGALSSEELGPLVNQGWYVASAHCLLSFANPKDAVNQFAGSPCALEGNDLAIGVLTDAFQQIEGQCFTLLKENKLLYHAAAVFATNFLPVLQSTADQLWRDSGMPENLLRQLRGNLLQNSIDNILKLGPAGALTGPAARGDDELVKKQANALMTWDPETSHAYQALSVLAKKLASQK